MTLDNFKELLQSGTFWTAIGSIAAVVSALTALFVVRRHHGKDETSSEAADSESQLSESSMNTLRALASRLRGRDEAVAYFPFVSRLDFGLTRKQIESGLSELRANGLIRHNEKVGIDNLKKVPSAYPTIELTEEGWHVYRSATGSNSET